MNLKNTKKMGTSFLKGGVFFILKTVKLFDITSYPYSSHRILVGREIT
jgi:hypothetical protein